MLNHSVYQQGIIEQITNESECGINVEMNKVRVRPWILSCVTSVTEWQRHCVTGESSAHGHYSQAASPHLRSEMV